LVLVIALGLVGLALNAANHRGAVSALQTRMESYVYLPRSHGVDKAGRFRWTGFRRSTPAAGSGVYVSVGSGGMAPRSALGHAPSGGRSRAPWTFRAGGERPAVHLRFIGWRSKATIGPSRSAGRRGRLEQQIALSDSGCGGPGAAGVILVLAQVAFLLRFRPLGRGRDVARDGIGAGGAARQHTRGLERWYATSTACSEPEINQQRIRNALDSLAHSLATRGHQAGLAAQRR
jgi:hypothetical protein